MAQVLPFRGILYNPAKVSGDDVVAPPYDIISPEYKEILYTKSPHNIVRIDFGKELPEDTGDRNRYTRSRKYLEQWMKEGVLVRDGKPSFYAYETDYELSGEQKRLRGILAMVRIEELGKGVYPHEATHSKPKADRLNLMRACMANISPIYSLYSSLERTTSRILDAIDQAPSISGTDTDGAHHKIYTISDESQIELIKKEFCDKPIFIADGHHRYEVALEFKREMESSRGGFPPEELNGEPSWNYVLMFLANMADEGISILPTHRLVRGISQDDIFRRLGKDFTVQEVPLDSDIAEAMAGGGKNTFGLYLNREKHWYVLKYRGDCLKDVHPALKDLDVVVLHELILKKDLGITDIVYEMSMQEAAERVRRKEFDGAFFLNPTGVKDVERVALSELRMPPKSTYFYPKLLTGMVMNSFKK